MALVTYATVSGKDIVVENAATQAGGVALTENFKNLIDLVSSVVTAGGNYLLKAGGVMSGDIDMGGNDILNGGSGFFAGGLTVNAQISGAAGGGEHGLTANSNGNNVLSIRNLNTGGYSAIRFLSSAGNEYGAIGYGNSGGFPTNTMFFEISDVAGSGSAPAFYLMQTSTFEGAISYGQYKRIHLDKDGGLYLFGIGHGDGDPVSSAAVAIDPNAVVTRMAFKQPIIWQIQGDFSRSPDIDAAVHSATSLSGLEASTGGTYWAVLSQTAGVGHGTATYTLSCVRLTSLTVALSSVNHSDALSRTVDWAVSTDGGASYTTVATSASYGADSGAVAAGTWTPASNTAGSFTGKLLLRLQLLTSGDTAATTPANSGFNGISITPTAEYVVLL